MSEELRGQDFCVTNLLKSSLRVNIPSVQLCVNVSTCFFLFSKVCFCFVRTVLVITPHLNHLLCILYVINQIVIWGG